MRSLLFAPGDDERKLGNALASGADALIVDLEDSVSAANKPRAREIASAFLALGRASDAPRIIVRVNPLESGLAEADLDAIVPGAPWAVMLPKAHGGASVQRLGAALAVREAEFGVADGATRILAIATESARAIFGMGSYAGCSARLEGLAWGGEDLSADLGAESHHDAGGWTSPYRLARDWTLLGAAAAGVLAIDGIVANFRDLDGLRAEALAAQRDGFGAKMAIHPAQVPIINEVFTPSPEALEKARSVIAAFAAAPGAGVVALNGEMLDRPHLLRARRLLDRAR
jgi:citrate lyase subunit beta/citryl-CoA lyase